MRKIILITFIVLNIFVSNTYCAKLEQEELRGQRPDADKGPTKIFFAIYVADLDNINGAEQSFDVNVFIRLRWDDKRLASTKSRWVRKIPLKDIWNPRIVLVNQEGLLPIALPEVADVMPDGTVIYFQRFVGSLSQPLYLNDFPLDKHRFTIHFAATGFSTDDVEFILEPDSKKWIASRISLPDWKILWNESKPYPYETPQATQVAGFAFQFEAKRFLLYFFWQSFVPLSLIVGMSWIAFWVDPDLSGAQLGLAGSSILSLVAYRFVLANLLPRLPYMTRMDYFAVGSMILVFLALIEVMITTILARKNHKTKALAVDRFARIIFPLAFVCMLLWSFVF